MGQLGEEVVHTALTTLRKIEDGLNAFGPFLLKIDFSALSGYGHNGLGYLGDGYHIYIFFVNIGKYLTKQVDMSQLRTADTKRRQLVHEQQKKHNQTGQHESPCRLIHYINSLKSAAKVAKKTQPPVSKGCLYG